MKYLALALLTLAACSATEPPTPLTRSDAEAVVKRVAHDMNLALIDCWRAGCRLVPVTVTVDTAAPPHMFVIPRPGG